MKRFLVARTVAIATPAAATTDGLLMQLQENYELNDLSRPPGVSRQKRPAGIALVALQAGTERRLPALTAHG